MSGSAPNPLMPPGANAAPAMLVAPPLPVSNSANQALASRTMRGRTQEHVIRRRDASGGELKMLAKIVNDPRPDRKEVADYINKLLRLKHIAADVGFRLLMSLPHDPDALRNWARRMFSAVMHEGIHAHAAFPREIFPSPPGGAGNTANQPPPPGS